MLQVNNQIITADTQDILYELRRQLQLKGVQRFAKIIQSGDNVQTNCPFHHNGQERKPSFGILTKTKGKSEAGSCHCFACGWSGSFTEMISNCLGYDDLGVQGSKWLVRNFLTMTVETRPDILDGLLGDTDRAVNYVSEEELDGYRYYHPYMWRRKLTKEIVEIFDIGYDKETECITFPVRDITGNTLFIARRSVNTKYFSYPQNVEKPVYGLYELYQLKEFPKEVIICESMIDALTAWVYGRYAVALNGLGNDLQFKQLGLMPNRKFILATDMDEAGQKARYRIKSHMRNKIVTEYIWDKNMAKDINDMAVEQFLNLKEYF